MNKKTIVMLDNEAAYIAAFQGKVRRIDPSYRVIGNNADVNVTHENLDEFIKEVINLVSGCRAECAAIFLDLSLTSDANAAESWTLGFGTGRALRKKFYEIPILILTNFPERIADGYFYDFDAFVSKADFTMWDSVKFAGTLSMATAKRQAIAENIPHYYEEYIRRGAPSGEVAVVSAFGISFTGSGSNLELTLDSLNALEDYFAKQTRITVIMFADMAESTKIKAEKGFVEGLRLTRLHNHAITRIVQETGGRVVKYIGDAVMARYDYEDASKVAHDCVNAAIKIQEAFDELGRQSNNGQIIRSKIGIAAGIVADFYGNDPQGSEVDKAARVQAMAKPGQILVARELLDYRGMAGVRSKVGAAKSRTVREYFSLANRVECKGFAKPIEICEVVWGDTALGIEHTPKADPRD